MCLADRPGGSLDIRHTDAGHLWGGLTGIGGEGKGGGGGGSSSVLDVWLRGDPGDTHRMEHDFPVV